MHERRDIFFHLFYRGMDKVCIAIYLYAHKGAVSIEGERKRNCRGRLRNVGAGLPLTPSLPSAEYFKQIKRSCNCVMAASLFRDSHKVLDNVGDK